MPKNRTPAKAKAAGHGVLPSMVAPHAAAPGQASQPLSKTNLPLAPATGLPCSEGRCMVASARGIVKGGVNVIRGQAGARDIVCIANDIGLVGYAREVAARQSGLSRGKVVNLSTDGFPYGQVRGRRKGGRAAASKDGCPLPVQASPDDCPVGACPRCPCHNSVYT